MKNCFAGMFRLIVLPAVLLAATAPAMALVVKLDSFSLTKNSGSFFVDDFSDGIPPPNTGGWVFPSGPASYTFLRGTFVETGGKLTLDTSTAPLGTNPLGNPVYTTRATLSTNINPVNPTLGLNSASTFSVTGLYDIASLGVGDTYGVRLVDRAADGSTAASNDFMQIALTRDSGGTFIRFFEGDFVAHTTTTFASVALNSVLLPITTDQIAFTLLRGDVSSNNIAAGYQFYDHGTLVAGGGFFNASANIFNGEAFTRAEFFAQALPVPEPETYAMLLAGLGLLGFLARHRKQQAA